MAAAAAAAAAAHPPSRLRCRRQPGSTGGLPWQYPPAWRRRGERSKERRVRRERERGERERERESGRESGWQALERARCGVPREHPWTAGQRDTAHKGRRDTAQRVRPLCANRRGAHVEDQMHRARRQCAERCGHYGWPGPAHGHDDSGRLGPHCSPSVVTKSRVGPARAGGACYPAVLTTRPFM